MATKYFFYSSEQLNLRKKIEKNMGKKFSVGIVIINGRRKPFTEMSTRSTSRFPDAKLVAKIEDGDTTTKYKMPEGV